MVESNLFILFLDNMLLMCSFFALSKLLTDEENKQVFGKCNNPNGHGHNYKGYERSSSLFPTILRCATLNVTVNQNDFFNVFFS